MKRNELSFLKKWYGKANRKPLMIRGARQVGKSTLVRLFSKELKLDLLEINLEINKLKFINSNSEKLLENLLQEIESILNKKLNKSSLLFFDEVQQCPEIIPLLRYFYEQRPEIAVICAGSLLEFVLEDHNFSMPVGRIEFLHLGPMKFSEFLLNGDKEELLNQIKDDFPNIKLFQFEQLTDQLRKFFFIGGMPEAIQVYFNTHSPQSVRDVHHSIISTYKNDFTKYTSHKDLPRIQEIFDILPSQFGKKIKYSLLSAELDSRKIKKSLNLLGLARLIHFCYHTNSSGIPLSSQKDVNVFKLYFLDIGLMHYLMGLKWRELNDYNDKNLLTQGLAAEQFIAQHLAYRRGPQNEPELFYWLRDKNVSNAEVDFVISTGRTIMPIEVKSGKSGSVKSLIQFIIEKKYSKAYRIDRHYRPYSNEIIERVSISNPSSKNERIEFELINLHLSLIEMLDDDHAADHEIF